MRLAQIIVRKDQPIIVQYETSAGASGQVLLDRNTLRPADEKNLAALELMAEAALPEENPTVLDPLDQEIAETRYRLQQLETLRNKR